MAAVIFFVPHTQLLARPLGISVAEAAQFQPHIIAAEIMLLLFAVICVAGRLQDAA